VNTEGFDHIENDVRHRSQYLGWDELLTRRMCKMKRILRWIGIVFGVLVGLVVLAVAGVYAVTEARINRTYDIRVEEVPIPTDADASLTASA
jgi:tetrahydromethanopterin S-methyltransferase subunit G